MTITYTIWDGSQFLGFQTAKSVDEMTNTVKELQKISKNVVAHMRKVETN
jgi:methyl-accepting chemotaxis protein